MKKRVEIIAVFLIVLLALPIVFSATPSDDFKKQVSRAAFYAENYEAGNQEYEYSKFLVYLYSVEDEIDSLLRLRGNVAVTTDDLTQILGDPEYTSWVLTEDEASEIQLEDPVQVWIGKIIFDGSLIQVKLNVVPYLFDNKDIVYKTNFIVVFKEDIDSEDLVNKFSEIETLAKTYALEPTVGNANRLTEDATNLEAVSKKVFEQSPDPYQVLLEIFGDEGLVKEQDVVVKEYEIYNKGKKVYAELSMCEGCKGVGDELWVLLSLRMENEKSQEIKYYVDKIFKEMYEEEGINGLKLKLIEKNTELRSLLDSQDYQEAYTVIKEIGVISEVYSKKINQGSNSEIINNYVSSLQFYSGLLEGYPLTKTSFYHEQIFQKLIYLETEEDSKEICNNDKDDNSNDKIDCQEEFCSGQVCETKTIIANDIDGQAYEKSVELYCISGECKEKETELLPPEPICGNKICEDGEDICSASFTNCTGLNCTATSDCSLIYCPSDCTATCVDHPAIECSGKVIFKGEDENGCPLSPICLANEDACQSDSDCTQPLCGQKQCVIVQGETYGKCELTKLEQCSQPECVDGEKKVCSNTLEEIITEICSLGNWQKTGEVCSDSSNPGEVKKEPVGVKQCSTSSDCGYNESMACVLGLCKFVPKNQNAVLKQQKYSESTVGVGITGFVVDLEATGNNVITGGIGITGIVPEPESSNINVLNEPAQDTAVQAKIYEPARESSGVSITGGIRNPSEAESIVPPEEDENALIKTGTGGDRELAQGVKEAFILEGVYRKDKKSNMASIYFSASGEKFGAISTLLDRYRAEGAEWQSWKLQSLQKERRELARTFNNEFADWYLNKFLVSQAEMSTKKNVLYEIYNYNFETQQEITRIMNGLKLRTLKYTNEDFISMDYASELGVMKCSETIKEVQFPGLRAVEIPVLSMDAVIFYPKYVIKESYKIALDGYGFPSASKERSYNLGLTDREIDKYKNNEKLKEKVKELMTTTKDGSFDMEVSFVSKESGEEELVYNLFVSLLDPDSEKPVKVYPMPKEEIPTGLDAKVTFDFDEIYSLLEFSEDGSWKYTLHPEWDTAFRPRDSINLFIEWFKMQSKISNVKNSLEVSSITDQGKIKDVLMDFAFLLGEPTKPQEVGN